MLGSLPILCGVSCIASANPACVATTMTFEAAESLLHLGNFEIRMEGAEPKAPPSLWEGPLTIRNLVNGGLCLAQPDGLITGPVVAFDERFLVISTTSGSNYTLETIDLNTCVITANSGKYSSPVVFSKPRFLVKGAPVAVLPCPEIR